MANSSVYQLSVLPKHRTSHKQSKAGCKHTRSALYQLWNRRCLFLFPNLFILLFIRSRFQTLPRQTATEEIEKDMTERFEVVPPRLLSPEMRVDRHVPRGPAEGFTFAVGNVLFGFGIAVLLGHTEIDDVYRVGAFGAGATDEEVVGFDVAVNEILFVDRLNARQLPLV